MPPGFYFILQGERLVHRKDKPINDILLESLDFSSSKRSLFLYLQYNFFICFGRMYLFTEMLTLCSVVMLIKYLYCMTK